MLTDITNFDKILKFISSGIGVRPVGSNGLRMAKEYIAKKFKDFCFEPYFHKFTDNNIELENVIASIKPQFEVENVVAFVAHYDSVPISRGAIDNASGVATLLELARALKVNLSPLHTELRFIALAGEEVGCVGSIAYLASLSDFELSQIHCAYNFDMFMSKPTENSTLVVNTLGGYDANGDFIVGTDESPFDNSISRAISKCAESEKFSCQLVKIQPEIWCPRNYGHSDHQSFFEKKIESANVTIRGAKEINGKLPFGYHTAKDIYSKEEFSFEQAQINLELVYASAVEIVENLEANNKLI